VVRCEGGAEHPSSLLVFWLPHTLTVSMMPAEAATLPVCVFHVCTVSKTFAAPLTWMPTRPAKTIVSEM
jgi:hypothetical protein